VTNIISLAKVSDVDIDDSASDLLCGGVISIGNFDGVHRGHAKLLGEVRRYADRLAGPAIAVVFDPHPAAILRPDRVPPKLTWMKRRADLMNRLGIDYLVICQTSAEFLRLSAETFFRSLVVERLGARAMVEGPNFFFGRDRAGDVQMLEGLCRKHDIRFSIAGPVSVDGEMISSTRIRALLQAGKVPQANELLGQPYRIQGRVIGGDQRGRKIGFPTANLDGVDVVIPAPGVYGGIGYVGEQKHLAAIHVGPKPTFDGQRSGQAEIHLLDYSGDLYGQTLQVDFITCVREIARFDSAQQLVAQLTRDVNEIRSQLASGTTKSAKSIDHVKGK
jgi:riboflavin kinase/FMN adenylyltransferase